MLAYLTVSYPVLAYLILFLLALSPAMDRSICLYIYLYLSYPVVSYPDPVLSI